ncbi:hypothetical protein AB1Y20_011643 [Prymnesium parvum]|uniref:HAT C-terminal dimerisation domain-containing protein n=1 Tax=Prymnesium parvum TaxID=97485 RepID=A0AB34IJ39_PRYPA
MSVQGQDAVAIGTDAGRDNQALNGIALGRQAGLTGQGANSIAIGNASGSALGERSIAIGIGSGVNAEADCVALGPYAGGITQETRSVAIGASAAFDSQGTLAVAIGYLAGTSLQSTGGVCIGAYSGRYNQGTKSIAIGYDAGRQDQQYDSVAVGHLAGFLEQEGRAIAVGFLAGGSSQGNAAIGIGSQAQNISAGGSSIGIGGLAGYDRQGLQSICVGNQAGMNVLGQYSVALGRFCLRDYGGTSTVAVGSECGRVSAGSNCILIGTKAGFSNAHDRTIVLNARTTELNTSLTDACYIAPMRISTGSHLMQYNSTTFEVSYSNTMSATLSCADVVASGISAGQLFISTVSVSGSVYIGNGTEQIILERGALPWTRNKHDDDLETSTGSLDTLRVSGGLELYLSAASDPGNDTYRIYDVLRVTDDRSGVNDNLYHARIRVKKSGEYPTSVNPPDEVLFDLENAHMHLSGARGAMAPKRGRPRQAAAPAPACSSACICSAEKRKKQQRTPKTPFEIDFMANLASVSSVAGDTTTVADGEGEEGAIENEARRYLDLPDAPMATDILDWWAKHQTTFPNLSVMAQQYLGVPATSASAERLFI